MAGLAKKRILLIAANSMDTQALSLPKEFREIEEGIELSTQDDLFSIKQVGATRYKDLRRKLLQYQPTIVHFSGHGSSNGLFLEDNNGRAKQASRERLVDLLEKFSDQIECVILNACDSESIAEAVSESIPYAIGMNAPISDPAAIEFSIGFYDALGNGRSYQDAFDFGLNAISGGTSLSKRSFDLSESDNKDGVMPALPPELFINFRLEQRLLKRQQEKSSPQSKKEEAVGRKKSIVKQRLIIIVGVLVFVVGAFVMISKDTSMDIPITIQPVVGKGGTEGLRSCRGETTNESIVQAAGRGHLARVETCIALQVDINMKDKNGWTSLHAASNSGQLAIAEKLVGAGIDINAVTNQGETALFLAVAKGEFDMVDYLLKNGVNKNKANKRGLLPFAKAKTDGMKDLLRKYD